MWLSKRHFQQMTIEALALNCSGINDMTQLKNKEIEVLVLLRLQGASDTLSCTNEIFIPELEFQTDNWQLLMLINFSISVGSN